ncbi:hypothetical protein ACH4VR_19750 [Streptomyces sp. NPDC020883]|uniref:hypothetical protein n=1 Tax=Streptomyces sp. NPDC020883 TaxID=3365099 RepID=UPI0037A0DFED
MSTTCATPSAVAQAAEAFARGGIHIDPKVLDAHLAKIADQASCSLLRDRFRNDFPHAAYHELLSTVAALRAVLGFAPSPTAREVMDWQNRQRSIYARAMQGPKTQYPVVFVDGPHRGVEMTLEGPAEPYPNADDPLGHLAGDSAWIAGPPAFVSLPIVWGDTERPGHGTARYKRGDSPNTEVLWPFWLCTDDVPLPTDARPYIASPASGMEGSV